MLDTGVLDGVVVVAGMLDGVVVVAGVLDDTLLEVMPITVVLDAAILVDCDITIEAVIGAEVVVKPEGVKVVVIVTDELVALLDDGKSVQVFQCHTLRSKWQPTAAKVLT